MKTLLSLACLLALAFYGAQSRPNVPKLQLIYVDNGGDEGYWGKLEVCPEGTVATGFALKVHPRQIAGDDTAVNGIQLRCFNSTTQVEANITSTFER